MAASPNYSDGSVIELTGGSSEFDLILGSAASRNQLVLLDFSVAWCGPCRMLAPVLAQLAQEHRGQLVVAKMDCEKTAANQALAASSGISAYPTMHLYSGGRQVETLRGANPPALRQAITRHLAQLGPPNAGSSENLAVSLATALAKVKSRCSYNQFLAAAKVLAAYVGNIVKYPTEAKYRRIKLSNASFQSKLLPFGGKECLEVLGFQERTEAMEQVLVMDHIPDQLVNVVSLLEQAISSGQQQQAGASTSSAPTTAFAPPAPVTASAPAAAPSAPPMPQPSAPPAPPAAAAGVDPARLAQMLSQAYGGAGSSAGASAPPAPAQAPSGSGALPRRQRRVVVTPLKLARVLEKMMLQAGLGQK